jgi:hypothetical protein
MKEIYMEQTIQLLSLIYKENPDFIKNLIGLGEIKELESGVKYLVIQ